MKQLNKISRFLGISLVFLILLFTNISEVQAAGSFSVSGGGTVSAGTQHTITITSSGAGRFDVSASGGGGLSSTSVSIGTFGGSASVTVTAPSSGSTTVTVVATDVTNEDESPLTGSKSVTYTVDTPSTSSPSTPTPSTPTPTPSPSTPSTPAPKDDRSTNNNLASLSVSDGTLSPEFDAGTTSYTVDVLDIETITIDASVVDSKASVSGTGEQTLELGENTFAIVVKAENQSTKTYTLDVTLKQSPTVFATYNSGELGFVKDVSEVAVPDGFEEGVITVSGEEVPVWTNNALGVSIVYLSDAEGTEDFYIYEDGIKSAFRPLGLLGRNIYVMDIPKEEQTREGMKFQEIVIEENTLMAWGFEDKGLADYYVIHVMNDTGKMVDYLYCKSDNSMILAPSIAPVTSDTYVELATQLETLKGDIKAVEASKKDTESKLMYAIIAAGVCFVLAFIAVILAIVFKKKNKSKMNHTSEVKMLDEIPLSDETEAEEIGGEVDDYDEEYDDYDEEYDDYEEEYDDYEDEEFEDYDEEFDDEYDQEYDDYDSEIENEVIDKKMSKDIVELKADI